MLPCTLSDKDKPSGLSFKPAVLDLAVANLGSKSLDRHHIQYIVDKADHSLGSQIVSSCLIKLIVVAKYLYATIQQKSSIYKP